VLPAMLLAPLLTEHLPDRLDDRAREHVRSVEGDAACQYLQRLAALHTFIVQAAADSDRYELRRSAETGRNLLWDAADLLQNQDTRSASTRLIDRERLMVQLADQVAQTLERTRAESAPGEADQPRGGEGPLGPLPPGFEPARQPTPPLTAGTSPLKGYRPMAQTQPDDSVRTTDVYLLFAHEPYYPGDGAQEINTTVVAAASLTPRCNSPTAPGFTTASPTDASRARSSRSPLSPTNWAAAPTGRRSATGRKSPPTSCSSSAPGSATPSASASPR
jgi:hypothetical protein